MKLAGRDRTISFALIWALLLCAAPALAGKGDAPIQYNLGLAEKARGNAGTAYDLFKKACMASEGIPEACLEWGAAARDKGDIKDMKRAYSSAVMLAPEDITARFELAMMLIERGDWVWAIEHLSEALPHAESTEDGALLRYYLGYAEMKNGDLEPAYMHMAQASRYLPEPVAQKATFYRGLIAWEQGERDKAVAMMERAQDGPDEHVAKAAVGTVESWSAFGALTGWQAQAIASIGINTHPLSDFLDNAGAEDTPVLMSEFRGDILVGSDTGHADKFFGGATIYRQENWAELDAIGPDWAYSADDMNFTMLLFQGAYVGHRHKWGLEHEIKLGLDADLQFLDRAPVFSEEQGGFVASDDVLVLLARTLAFKAWWSMAKDADSIWSLRLRSDVIDNRLSSDMSAWRTRLRIANTRNFLDKALQLKVLVGGRYDRTYKDPAIIKYDRLRPELWVDLKWNTPWKRLSFLVGGKLVYSWYMNSDTISENPANSFRPMWTKPEYPDGTSVYSELDNLYYEADYYNLKRHDFEWEVLAEAHLRLWPRATLALKYKHHQRLSNIDDAPVPRVWNSDTSRYEEVGGVPTYGYDQDLVLLELKQAF